MKVGGIFGNCCNYKMRFIVYVLHVLFYEYLLVLRIFSTKR